MMTGPEKLLGSLAFPGRIVIALVLAIVSSPLGVLAAPGTSPSFIGGGVLKGGGVIVVNQEMPPFPFVPVIVAAGPGTTPGIIIPDCDKATVVRQGGQQRTTIYASGKGANGKRYVFRLYDGGFGKDKAGFKEGPKTGSLCGAGGVAMKPLVAGEFVSNGGRPRPTPSPTGSP
jgi:hypothetical protein